MTPHDDLQQLWQDTPNEHPQENTEMLLQLINEKRTGFHELVRSENQSEYIVTLIFGPLTLFCAAKAKYAWPQAGYLIMGLTMLAGAAAIWLSNRRQIQSTDRSLHEHLSALIADYDDRLRHRSLAGWAIMGGLTLGAFLVIAGSPGHHWIIALALLGTCWAAQITKGRTELAKIRAKREEAERLLAAL